MIILRPFFWLANIAYYLYMLILSLIFELHLPFYLVAFVLLRKGSLTDAVRIHNVRYGVFLTKIFWPLARIERTGLDNVPANGTVLAVFNHRSAADVIFSSAIPRSNVGVIVRSWPFRLPITGWYMRLARYIDIERTPFDRVVGRVRELADRGVCWVTFPEGHRSRDGKLQKFYSGPFVLAVESDIPVLPVCMTGTEDFCPPGSPLLWPARVRVDFLPLVYPSSFPEKRRAYKLRRHVEEVFRTHLGE